ncbi:uroporphyrinogen-III synthase [Roseivivax isoporae]|uniref:Uroporphyrinogen-III synthase n=1 Tax=Roseivivax isoporae LMG 25204 TaxID=1449351 RepID=X7F9W5_9RHOB|nr:uroporphyrinogen-III synthase [Roseivivax isoporae]ETX29570.1 uroporphyrinogen-III synthase [Roseivivax isoporae LMG 25204]
MPVLLLTRPEEASLRFLAELSDLAGLPAFRPVLSPLLEIAVTGPLPDMSDAPLPVFTSAQGVSAFTALGGRAGGPCYAVGDATARAAGNAGFAPRSAGGDAAALVARILADRPDRPLLHLHGTHVRGDVAGALSAAGLPARAAAIYDQRERAPAAEARAALDGSVPVVAPLFSPRTAAALARAAPFRAPVLVAAMSPAVAEAVRPAQPDAVTICKEPTGPCLRAKVHDLLLRAAALEGGRGAQ